MRYNQFPLAAKMVSSRKVQKICESFLYEMEIYREVNKLKHLEKLRIVTKRNWYFKKITKKISLEEANVLWKQGLPMGGYKDYSYWFLYKDEQKHAELLLKLCAYDNKHDDVYITDETIKVLSIMEQFINECRVEES